jgi:hypothetical protein
LHIKWKDNKSKFKYNSIGKIDEIPRIYEIQKKNYKLLSMILHFKAENHFVSVFDIADKKYVVDDLLDEAILLNKSSRKHG